MFSSCSSPGCTFLLLTVFIFPFSCMHVSSILCVPIAHPLQTSYVAEGGYELTIVLFLPFKFWYYRCVSSCPTLGFYVFLFLFLECERVRVSLCMCVCIHTYVSVCLYVCVDVLKCTCEYSFKMCVEARGQPQVSFSGTASRSFETPSLISS